MLNSQMETSGTDFFVEIMLEKNPGKAGWKGFVCPKNLDAARSFLLKKKMGKSLRVFLLEWQDFIDIFLGFLIDSFLFFFLVFLFFVLFFV